MIELAETHHIGSQLPLHLMVKFQLECSQLENPSSLNGGFLCVEISLINDQRSIFEQAMRLMTRG